MAPELLRIDERKPNEDSTPAFRGARAVGCRGAGHLGAAHTLPESAAGALSRSLDAAQTHAAHVWRDTAPLNDDGTVNAYIEIAQGDRRKWEFDMGANARAIDRMMPDGLRSNPIAYGFVPQTVSYDGVPFDALVTLPAGSPSRCTPVRGVIVGRCMLMEDKKGLRHRRSCSPPWMVRGRPVQELSAR